MRRLTQRSPRGFSLIELMIATAISVVVLVGGMTAGMALQRRSTMEEGKLKSQDEMRSAKDFFIGELVRAGTPFGNARIYTGETANPYRFGIQVLTDTYPNPFGSAYSGPPAPNYSAMGSDYIEVLSKAVDSQSIFPTAPCVGSSGPFRNGNQLCLAGIPSTDTASWKAGRYIIISDSTMGMGCLATISSDVAAGAKTVLFSIGISGADPVLVTDPCRTGGAIWNSTNATVALAQASGYRVNWASGGPILETSQDVLNSSVPWTAVSRQVERIKITLGLESDLNAPGTTTTVWFGPAVPTGTPPPDSMTSIDNCNGTCAIPGVSGAQDLTFQNPYERLMRRVRTVDVSIRVRSPTIDTDKVQMTTTTVFATDLNELTPMDGYTRRTSVFHAAPRNMSFAGNFAP